MFIDGATLITIIQNLFFIISFFPTLNFYRSFSIINCFMSDMKIFFHFHTNRYLVNFLFLCKFYKNFYFNPQYTILFLIMLLICSLFKLLSQLDWRSRLCKSHYQALNDKKVCLLLDVRIISKSFRWYKIP